MRFQIKPIVLAIVFSGITLSAIAAPERITKQAGFLAATSKTDEEYQAIINAWEQDKLDQMLPILSGSFIDEKTKHALFVLGEAYEAEDNSEQAIKIYSILLKQQKLSDVEKQHLRLKLALLQSNSAAFIQLASDYPEIANNIAKIVSILTGNRQAMQILAPIASSNSTTQLTMTTWLLESNELDTAEKMAWLAFELAQDKADKQYALALYAEAIRQNNATERALSKLKNYTDDTVLTPFYLDLLLEAGKFEQALAVVDNSKLPEIRDRRTNLLLLTNNTDALFSYYQQLITSSPANANGYFGLAGLLINRGDIQAAKQVFETLGANNSNNKVLLLSAAKRMLAMNMQQEAIQLLQNRIDHAAADPQVNYFLFETYLESGEEESAHNILIQLKNSVEKNSPSMLLVVKGYENLNNPETALQELLNYQNSGGVLSYDQQLHLAELAKSAGREDIALSQWQTLWQQATLPARKHFLEGLLVKAMLKNGSIDRQIHSLEHALASDTITPHELDLLVALYLAKQELPKAEITINQYATRFALPEKQRLDLLASLFGRSRTYGKLNEVWQQLAIIDIENAPQYWQQITLNSLRNNAFDNTNSAAGISPQEQRLAQIDQLITNFSNSTDSVDPAFVASIYTMGGLPHQAIEQYKQAVKDNTSPDALLQLIELYKKEGQFKEATRLLQIRLISAANNTEFMNAVDGILNLFDISPESRNENSSAQLRNSTLSWLQRQVLMRLAFTEDDTALLMVLSDIAQTQGEFDTAERLSNLILAQPNVQRAALLRSLITQFSGKDQQSQSSGPAIGDEKKKLKYGRRLLALNHDFPPALYASLGRALLADGDIQGAERAFSLMTEIPGILNVKQLKADAYASQHLDASALTYFQEALQTEQSNLDLIRKTAVLEEQFNQDDIANFWYWQGLKLLINRTPNYQLSYASMRNSDSFRYYPTLSEGFLLTLKGSSEAQTLMAELQDMLAKALLNIEPQNTEVKSLQDFPRLALIADLIQRTAFHENLWENWSTAIREIQTRIPAFQPQDNLLTADAHTDKFDALNSLKNQAHAGDNFRLSLALAMHQHNWAEVTQIASSLIKMINAEGELTPLSGAQYFQLLLSALDNMPAIPFAENVWPIMQTIPNQKLLTFQILRFMPDTYQKLETALKSPLITDSDFTSLVITHINTPPMAGMPYSYTDDNDFNRTLFRKLTETDIVTLWEKLERDYAITQAVPPVRDELVKQVLSNTISSSHKEQVSKLLHQYVTANGNSQAPCSVMAPKMMLLDVATENQALVLKQATEVARLSAQCSRLPEFIAHYYAGRHTEAYAALRALNKDATTGISYQIFDAVINQRFRKEKQAFIDQFLASPEISAEDAHQFINDIVMSENNVERQQYLLTRLHNALPKDEVIFNHLKNMLWRSQQFALLEDIVYAWISPKATTDEKHLLFYLHQLNKHDEQRATANNSAELLGEPITNVKQLVAWLNKSMSSGVNNTGLPSLYSLIFAEYAERYPDDNLVIELKNQQGAERLVAPDSVNTADISRIVKAFKNDKQEAIKQLNTLWRNGIEGINQFDGKQMSREQLIYVIYDNEGKPNTDSTTQADFLRQIAHSAEGASMLESWIKALPTEQQSSEQRLYDLLVTGWKQQGVLDSNVHDLLKRASLPSFTTHDLQMLATAIPKSSISINEEQLSLLLEKTENIKQASIYLRLNMADVFSRAGKLDIAGSLVLASVWQMNYPPLTVQYRVLQSRYNAPKLSDAITPLSSWHDKQLAKKYLDQIIQITQKTIEQNAELNDYWHTFILFAYSKLGVVMDDALAQEIKPSVAKSVASKIAYAKYAAASLNDNKASIELISEIISATEHNNAQDYYNRAQEALAMRLYGPHSPLNNTRVTAPWVALLVDDTSADWQKLVMKMLSSQPDGELKQELIKALSDNIAN